MLCLKAAVMAMSMLLVAGVPRAQLPAGGKPFSLPRVGQLPQAIQMHGSAVAANRLYIIGGHTGSLWSSDVWSGHIGADGRVGFWRREAALPECRAYLANSVQVAGNRLYVAGGDATNNPGLPDGQLSSTLNVAWCTVGSEGILSPWRNAPATPGPAVTCNATAATDKHLYIIGGNGSDGISDVIQAGTFDANGAPAQWRVAGRLPQKIWFHGAAIHQGQLYVWGGLLGKSSTSINRDVWAAPIGPDGSIGIWRSETPMNTPVYSSAFCIMNNVLLCIGGRYEGAHPTNAIWYSRIDGGRLAPWKLITTDLEARTYHAVGYDNARASVYVSGGKQQVMPGTGHGSVLGLIQAFQLGR